MIGYAGGNEVELPDPFHHPHCYLVGATNSGKSELLKCMTHDLLPKDAAIAVLDIDGKFVSEMARWPEWVGETRLCYFNPVLRQGYTPCINPLEPSGVSPLDTSERAVRIKQVLAEQLQSAFRQMLEGEGGEVTRGMSTVLMPCLLTLFDRPRSTLKDLQRFMDNGHNGDLIAFAKSRTHYETVPSFFEMDTGFKNTHYNATKNALYSRLQTLFNSNVFVEATCGPSTIDLARMIEWKKVMLFNLADGVIGPEGSRALGRLIIAQIQGIAMRRAEFPEKKHVPIHLMVDECGSLVSESVRLIMQRTRKLGLYLTLAQQTVGESMTPSLRDAIIGNANVTITGAATKGHQDAAAKLVGVRPEALSNLHQGHFFMAVGNQPPARFRSRDDLLGTKHSMTPPSWERLVARQLRAYYRRKGQVTGQVPPETPPDPDMDDAPVKWG
jgi:hypothetical protein